MHIYASTSLHHIEPSFFKTTSAMHRRLFEGRHLVNRGGGGIVSSQSVLLLFLETPSSGYSHIGTLLKNGPLYDESDDTFLNLNVHPNNYNS